MSKEKQIEEMAREMCHLSKECETCQICDERYHGDGEPCYFQCVAKEIIKHGYRKQSEWISVEERLPRSEQMVLCYTPCDGFMFVGFYREVKPNPYWKSYWNIITAMRSTKKMTKKVTHWMPLPEAPKKGGGE